jgi:Leucine-rich repeat (LRR) protein
VSWKGKTLELNLASRSLASIPRFAWQLLSLQSCVLSMNRLRSLPMDAVVWSCLKRLELQCNVLAKLPAELFADMPCLEHLDLSNNQVSRTARYPARLHAAPQSMQRSTLTPGGGL